MPQDNEDDLKSAALNFASDIKRGGLFQSSNFLQLKK